MSTFWSKYPVIQRDLEYVKDIMLNNIRCSEKTIEAALRDLINSGGKMLRPAFLLLGAGFGQYNPKHIYKLGSVVEMLHMATLIHDDIVDDSPLRRGDITIQSRYGKNYAVFMGDFLFTRCFMLLSEGTSLENLKKVSRVISRICIGEIEQFSFKFKKDVSINRYLKRIAGKTAALFSMSLYIGTSESGCEERLSKLVGRVGYNIGMAFQIIDDILDFSGEEKVVGKPVGNDIKEGIFTLPLIYALQADNGDLEQILQKNSYSDSDISNIVKMVRSFNGIEKARILAQRYTTKAFDQLSRLPE
jgi:heptaprenyl diphosphate synthase